MAPGIREGSRVAAVPISQPANKLEADRRLGAGAFILIIDSVWLLGMMGWALVHPDAILAVIGAAAAWITAVPFVFRTFTFLSPWSLLSLTVHLGGLMRGFYIAIYPQHAQDDIERLFLLGQDPGSFLWPGLWYITGLAIAAVAYITVFERDAVRASRLDTGLVFRDSIVLPTVAFAVIGFVALIAYVQASGGFSLEDLSSKRSVIAGLEVGDEYANHGTLRFLNSFGQVALWAFVAKTVYDDKGFSYFSARGLFIFVLALNAVALPFYSSTRAEVAFILLVVLAIDIGIRRRPPSFVAVLVGGVVTIFLLVFMTLSRGASEASESVGASLASGLEELVVLNRNFGDYFTFAHVTAAIPDVLDWARGSTIIGYLVAPVPRAIWPEKPLISIGPTIGVLVYGNERSGVPPGWFGEWYWNFGVIGFVLGSILLGVILKSVATSVRSVRWDNPVFVVFYAVVFFRFGYFAIGGGIGSSVFKSVVQMVILLTFLAVATRRPNSDPSDSGKTKYFARK